MSTTTAGPVAEQSSPETDNTPELRCLHKRLQRISDKILPLSPYLLQIAEKVSPDLGHHHSTNWSKGTPFAPNEEALQYVSFLNVPLELGVIRSVGGWDNDKGELEDSSPNGQRNFKSGTTTPKQGQTAGKRLTLADYAKRKTAGQSGVKIVTQSNGTESIHVKVNETQDKVNDGKGKPSDKEVKINNAKFEVTDKKDNVIDTTHAQSKVSDTHDQAIHVQNKADGVQTKANGARDPTKVVQDKVDVVNATLEKASIVEVSSQATKKRSSAAMTESKLSQSTIQNSVEPPQKKPRISSPQGPSKPESLPTDLVELKMPGLLSPTLPSTIEEVLAKLPNSSKPEASGSHPVKPTTVASATSSKASTSHQLSSSQSSQGKKSKIGPSPDVRKETLTPNLLQNSKSVNTARGLSPQTQPTSRDTTKKAHDKTPQVNGAATKHPTVGTSQNSRKEPVSSASSGGTASKLDQARKSKIVVLKLRKSQHKNFARLVQLSDSKTQTDLTQLPKHANKELAAKVKELERNIASKANKDLSQSHPDKRSATEHHAKPIRSEIGKPIVEGPKSTEKRARTEDEQDSHRPLSKRQKQTSTVDLPQKPSTPIPPPFKSPSVSAHGSSQKVHENNKIVYSRRFEAGEVDVKTPQGSTRAGTPVAPNSIEKANRDGRSASNTSSIVSSLSSKSDEIQAWKAEQTKYMRLGRDLKHDADALFRLCESNDDAQLEKRAIATGIETILCFMLGYALVDEVQGRSSRKIIDTANWGTIFGFLHRVKAKASGHTLLHGLCRQLEAVCLNIITASDLERLAQAEPPSATAVESEKLKADSTNDIAVKASESHRDYMKLKSKIAENTRNAHLLWIEGAFELSVEDLQNSFPHSWRRKARAPLAKAREKLTPGSLDGDFYLPMSSITTGIEAVRAGWTLLCEWSKKDKVKWAPKFGL